MWNLAGSITSLNKLHHHVYSANNCTCTQHIMRNYGHKDKHSYKSSSYRSLSIWQKMRADKGKDSSLTCRSDSMRSRLLSSCLSTASPLRSLSISSRMPAMVRDWTTLFVTMWMRNSSSPRSLHSTDYITVNRTSILLSQFQHTYSLLSTATQSLIQSLCQQQYWWMNFHTVLKTSRQWVSEQPNIFWVLSVL